MLLLALLVASGVLTAVRGLGAFNNSASCTGYGYGYGYGYANPAPQLTLVLSRPSAVAGAGVTASGTFTQNGCALPNETITIKRQSIANSVPFGSFKTFLTTTTNASGAYSLTFGTPYDSVFQSSAAAKSGRPAVNSPARVLRVFARVTASAPRGSHLLPLVITGKVLPLQNGPVVTLYRFSPTTGKPYVVARQRLYSASAFRFKLMLAKGNTKLRVAIGYTTQNLYGSTTWIATRT